MKKKMISFLHKHMRIQFNGITISNDINNNRIAFIVYNALRFFSLNVLQCLVYL
uniref:Uncharacterized protein n=1 Tax=Octopus bimaculoides TaxID=37653 RepID=A0A0L8ICN9_OCTBM